MIGTENRRADFIGNGIASSFTFAFQIRSEADLRVWVRDTDDVLTLLTLNTDYSVTGGETDSGGQVILTAGALTTGYKIAIRGRRVIKQETDIRNQGDFYPEVHEDEFDVETMIDQQQQEELARSLRMHEAIPPSEFDPELGPEFVGNDGAIMVVNPTGDGMTAGMTIDSLLALVGAGGSGLVGLPTDGEFGNDGGIAGLDPTDRIADGFDKIEAILELLAPVPPDALADVPLVLAGAYSAREATTGTLITNCTSDTTPAATASNFRDGNAGTLSAEIDGAAAGSLPITTADDSGTDNALTIVSDTDPYVGQAGKENFWRQLVASIIAPSALSLGIHTYELEHSTTGVASLSLTVDDPGIVTFANLVGDSVGASSFVSGVPGLALGEDIDYSYDVLNAVRTHYHATRVARVESSQTSADNLAAPGTPANGAILSFSGAVQVVAAAYAEDVSVTYRGYNAEGTAYSNALSTGVRVDTLSNEAARLKSGQGQFPAQGSGAAQFGDAFVSSTSLVTAGNEELQLLGGQYGFPTGNYTGDYPVGPNYSAAAGGSYANYRWLTLNLGAIAAVVNTQINILGGMNLGSSTLISGLLLYVRVVGATPTTGWIDANAAYPGVGNPTADGDAALVVGSSDVDTKVVTFGAAPKTGNVWIRIGVPSASTKRFTGVTRS